MGPQHLPQASELWPSFSPDEPRDSGPPRWVNNQTPAWNLCRTEGRRKLLIPPFAKAEGCAGLGEWLDGAAAELQGASQTAFSPASLGALASFSEMMGDGTDDIFQKLQRK